MQKEAAQTDAYLVEKDEKHYNCVALAQLGLHNTVYIKY